MTTAAYQQIIAAPPRDRLDLFLATANQFLIWPRCSRAWLNLRTAP